MANIRHLKDQEGYLLIDNRASGGGVQEDRTYTCSHCQAIVVLNSERQRERAYCRGCNHRICDGCAAIRAQTLTCKTYEQVIDESLNKLILTGA